MTSPQNEEIIGWLSKIKGVYGKKREDKFIVDEPLLEIYLAKLKSELNDKPSSLWRMESPHRVGGTGVIFKASHVNMPHQELVLKFNRPRISSAEMSMVENELQILQHLDHPNIIHVFDVGRFEVDAKQGVPNVSFIIEPFIPGAKTLREYVASLSTQDQRATEKHTQVELGYQVGLYYPKNLGHSNHNPQRI